MTLEFVKARLVKTRVMNVATIPRLGILTLETSEGRLRTQIDEAAASDLLEEILTFLGVPGVR